MSSRQDKASNWSVSTQKHTLRNTAISVGLGKIKV